MADIHYIRGSSAPKISDDQAHENASPRESALEPGLHCAYNETRQSFVATNVDVADGAGGGAEARLHTMEPGSGLALWISPFRGISPSCARFPLDLVFLDKDARVLETVEFFPMSVGGEESAQAASILVLAADSLAQVQVKAGDRLTIAQRQEMLHRLPHPKGAGRGVEAQSAAPIAAQNREVEAQEGNDGLNGKQWMNGTGPVKDSTSAGEDRSRIAPAQNAAQMLEKQLAQETREPAAAANGNGHGGAASPVQSPDHGKAAGYEKAAATEKAMSAAADNGRATAMPEAAPVAAATPVAIPLVPMAVAADEAQQVAARAQREPWKKDEVPRTWLQRLLLGENKDPRRCPRKSTPELAAYFFTGGTPMQHAVRDISNSGLYIMTHERWFPGTIVQLTLSEAHRRQGVEPISLYAKVVRSGRDGVGLRFILEGIDRRKAGRFDIYEPTNGIRAAQVSEFVEQLKAS